MDLPNPLFRHENTAKSVLTIFEPDICMPSQWRAMQQGAALPEKRLMLAVLEDGVHTYLRLRHVDSAYARRLVSDAREWFASDATHPFSFAYICDALNIDPQKLRSGLDATTATGLSARQRMQGRATMSTEAQLDHGTPNPLYAVGNKRGVRRCTKCHKRKGSASFSRRSDRPGFKSWCKACINARPDRVRRARVA